jgi:type IV secretion system protein VirB10
MSTPPPPPNDPFENGNGDPFANGDSGDQDLAQGAPSVAASPGRTLVVLGVLGVVLVFLLYKIFFSGGEEQAPPAPAERPVPTAPIEPPPLPEEPPAAAAPPTFTPIDIPQPAKIDLITPEEDSAAQQQRQARLRSSMVVTDNSGGLGSALSSSPAPATAATNDPNSSFEATVTNANTKAQRVEATRIGDLRRTIAQGRIIQATTESALNTELPAPIRAIVSRDTYGEAGTEPLIPKGSRLIGTYNTDILGGQSRVYVVWTRVIRPDGVDVMLNSPLVDQIGEAGVGGQVDTKFQQIFSRSVMASIISIAFAIGSDEISGGGTSSTTNSTFGTTQSGDAASTATVNALNRLGSTTDGFLQRFIPTRPTILVDQGTPVNVFVNRDLVFPGDMAGTRIVN